MHRQLYTFLEDHDILFKNQFGFRKKCSTAHSLIEITEKIKESIDSGKFGCGIFIDLKKSSWHSQSQNTTPEIRALWYQRNYLKMVWVLPHWQKTVCFLQWCRFGHESNILWSSTRLCTWSIIIFNLHKWFAKYIK